MNQDEFEMGGPNIQSKTGSTARWVGAALGLVAAGAIAVTFYFANELARPTASVPAQPVAQSVPDAAAQGIDSYVAAHRVVAAGADTAPDVARRAARDAARAAQGQAVPDAAAQGVAGYVGAHAISQGQAVPDAAQQGVNAYLRAHDDPSFHSPVTQFVPDSDRHTAADYQAAQAALTKPGDRSFHTPATSNYFYQAPAGQAVPDEATQDVENYLRAHSVNAPGLWDRQWVRENR